MSKFIKTTLFCVMTGLIAFGAVAEEATPATTDAVLGEEVATAPELESTDVALTEPIVKEEVKERNPKIAFPHGLQLGIGLSGTTG